MKLQKFVRNLAPDRVEHDLRQPNRGTNGGRRTDDQGNRQQETDHYTIPRRRRQAHSAQSASTASQKGQALPQSRCRTETR